MFEEMIGVMLFVSVFELHLSADQVLGWRWVVPGRACVYPPERPIMN